MAHTPKPEDVSAAIPHTVYEYANLVSAGTLLASPLESPLNTHVQDAFLLDCRKVAEFFALKRRKQDVLALDFCAVAGPPIVALTEWANWKHAMDRQLAHLSYSRVRHSRSWDGSQNKQLLREFQAAFRLFLARVDLKHQKDFQTQLQERSAALGVPLP